MGNRNIKDNKRYSLWRGWIIPIALVMLAFTSCSETNDDINEYPNWKETNETYFNQLYATARQAINNGDDSWKIITNWSLNDSLATAPEDHIIAHVLKKGSGTVSPLYSDTVMVHYSGRLLPSTTYSTGYVFDKTWTGDFNPTTALPHKMGVSQTWSTNSSGRKVLVDNIDGFTTVLQYMHVGDEWEVYIPYQLAYGDSENSAVPPYSTLIFDLTLVKFYRAGAVIPDYSSKEYKPVIWE